MEDFTNKVALVSGASRGIGRAIAEKFLRQGAQVIGLFAGNQEAAERVRQDNLEYSEFLSLIQCDITDSEQVKALFVEIEEKYDRLDILINNAGIRKDSILALMGEEQWNEVLDTNLTGTYLMCKNAVPLMMKNKYGRIISITSPVAHLGFQGQANYAASKAGQVALTKTLAKEVARKKITVNCVSPGFIDTDFIKDLDPSLVSNYKKMVPMRRFGSTDEVADGVSFLAGSHSAYITGTVLEITGGL